jgi:hypothetical protein
MIVGGVWGAAPVIAAGWVLAARARNGNGYMDLPEQYTCLLVATAVSGLVVVLAGA